VDWLCPTTRLPVLLKGIVHPDDAREAVQHGVAGIIVSNHGGRQLDGAPAPAEALPGIAAAVVRALTLGARAVAVGRPVLWGLAWGGEAGVSEMLGMLRREIDLALALCGCASPSEVPAATLLDELPGDPRHREGKRGG